MHCKYCGNRVNDNEEYCPSCGAKTERTPPKAEGGSQVWFGILGYFVPAAGFVLFLVFNNKNPKRSKAAGIGALIGFITRIIVGIILSAMFFTYFVSRFPTLRMPGTTYTVSEIERTTVPEISNYTIPEIERTTVPEVSNYTIPEIVTTPHQPKKDSDNEANEKVADVSFGTFTASTDGYLTKTSLDVAVKNTTDTLRSFYITVEAVNANGDRLGTDMLLAQSLRPGQTIHLTAFAFVEQNKIEQFKTAKFHVLKIDSFDF